MQVQLADVKKTTMHSSPALNTFAPELTAGSRAPVPMLKLMLDKSPCRDQDVCDAESKLVGCWGRAGQGTLYVYMVAAGTHWCCMVQKQILSSGIELASPRLPAHMITRKNKCIACLLGVWRGSH